nr:ribonuclease H-like domain-containing protein [Tanacetum cinerariifolium]
MRPFKCLVTILNTKDHLGKFDGKADKEFFVGYYLNSNAFKVFNNWTRIMEENLHVRFIENTPNIIGSGLNWLFDIKALTKLMNYKPVIAGSQSNGNACTKACDDAGKARMETVDEIECRDLEKEDNVNNTKIVNADGTNEVNNVGENTNNELPFDPEMPELEDISTFNFSNKDEDDGAEADINNLDTAIQVSPTPTIKIHIDHPLDQVIGDLHSTIQTRNISKNLEEHGFVTTIHQRTNHKDLQNCLFACVLLQEEPRKTLMDLPYGKRDIGTKWVYRNKKDEREVKNARTPMETQKPLLKDEDGEEVDVHMYRSMIGSLMYLTSSRNDIMFAVCAYARYQVTPKVSHLYAANMIFKYFKDYQLAERLQAEEKQELMKKRKLNCLYNRTKLVEESSKKTEEKVTEGSFKRARTELEQESVKKQKIDDEKETTELK